MLASEIDDIFAGKSTGKKIPTADSSILTGKKKKKKRKNKDNKTESTQEHVSSETSKSKKSSEAVIEGASKLDGKKRKRTPPQEIVDPSLPAAKKRQKVEQAVGSSSKKKTERDDMKKFKDSRGSSGRKRTEEGYLIYTEDELGLNKEGGDTPLCPFDCECCQLWLHNERRNRYNPTTVLKVLHTQIATARKEDGQVCCPTGNAWQLRCRGSKVFMAAPNYQLGATDGVQAVLGSFL